MTDDNWTGSWCPQCGPDVKVDEDGCCVHCGCDCTGEGAELALRHARHIHLLHEAIRGLLGMVPEAVDTTDCEDRVNKACIIELARELVEK